MEDVEAARQRPSPRSPACSDRSPIHGPIPTNALPRRRTPTMRSPSLFLLALALPLAGAAVSASGETITVTTLEDVRDFGGAQRVADLPGPDGRISFGEAVAAANNEPGPQAIHFAI